MPVLNTGMTAELIHPPPHRVLFLGGPRRLSQLVFNDHGIQKFYGIYAIDHDI
jgi:hypothetical protein